MSKTPFVIPVVVRGDYCLVFEDDPDADGKLQELYAYLRKLPVADNWDIPSLAGALLRNVKRTLTAGSQVYECEVTGVDTVEHGKLVFVLSTFMTAGMRITWKMVADDIGHYLEAAAQSPLEESNE